MKYSGFIFSATGIKKYWELVPLIASLSGACGGAVIMLGYSLATKPDVALDKRQITPPWERVDRERPQKLLTFHTKYEKELPEIEKLRREIGSYKY